jgi:hypothetical protein
MDRNTRRMEEPGLFLRRRRLKRQRLNLECILFARIQESPERILVPQRGRNNELMNPVVRK